MKKAMPILRVEASEGIDSKTRKEAFKITTICLIGHGENAFVTVYDVAEVRRVTSKSVIFIRWMTHCSYLIKGSVLFSSF